MGGKKVFIFAPSTAASRGQLRYKGFEDADTAAALKINQSLHEKIRGQMMCIDEAGTVSVRDRVKVFRIAWKDNAQHSPRAALPSTFGVLPNHQRAAMRRNAR